MLGARAGVGGGGWGWKVTFSSSFFSSFFLLLLLPLFFSFFFFGVYHVNSENVMFFQATVDMCKWFLCVLVEHGSAVLPHSSSRPHRVCGKMCLHFPLPSSRRLTHSCMIRSMSFCERSDHYRFIPMVVPCARGIAARWCGTMIVFNSTAKCLATTCKLSPMCTPYRNGNKWRPRNNRPWTCWH